MLQYTWRYYWCTCDHFLLQNYIAKTDCHQSFTKQTNV